MRMDQLVREDALQTSGLSRALESGSPAESGNERVKLIERQGYGRARLDLLRRCVLTAN
jgi:transposase